MATVNFYLKKRTGSEKNLICLVYFCSSFRIKLSTGQSIANKYWDEKNQKVRKTFSKNFTEQFPERLTTSDMFNRHLDKLKHSAQGIEHKLSLEGKPFTKETVRQCLFEILKRKKESSDITFFKALEDYITLKTGKVSPNTLKMFGTLKRHLMTFQAKGKYPVTFEGIDYSFYEKFTSFLFDECGHTTNTAGSNIRRLKMFLNWSARMGYNKHSAYRDLKTMNAESTQVALTEKELISLYNLSLPENSKLHKVRETFCFGCFTGLRYSDIAKVRKEHLQDGELHISIQKTKETRRIPLNDFSRSILERNDFNLPVISNQKTNTFLKELAEKAGITGKVKITRHYGAKRDETTVEKWQLIKTHTARRTFITLSLEKGMRPDIIKSITGHKSDSNFNRYIRVEGSVRKKEMEKWNNMK